MILTIKVTAEYHLFAISIIPRSNEPWKYLTSIIEPISGRQKLQFVDNVDNSMLDLNYLWILLFLSCEIERI